MFRTGIIAEPNRAQRGWRAPALKDGDVTVLERVFNITCCLERDVYRDLDGSPVSDFDRVELFKTRLVKGRYGRGNSTIPLTTSSPWAIAVLTPEKEALRQDAWPILGGLLEPESREPVNKQSGLPPAVLTAQAVRLPLRRVLVNEFPRLPVVAYSELRQDLQLIVVDRLYI